MSGLQGKKKRRPYLVMALSEVALLTVGFACSTTVDPYEAEPVSTGGMPGSGGIKGTGGEDLLATGGRLVTSSGDADDGDGDWNGGCAITTGSSLEPPCSAPDILLTEQCSFENVVLIEFSLAELSVPTAKHLRLFLLPAELEVGQGGQGGESAGLEPHPLEVELFPETVGTSGPDGFEVTGSGAQLQALFPLPGAGLAGYFVDYAVADRYTADFKVALLAIMDGDQVLLERRVIFTPVHPCLSP